MSFVDDIFAQLDLARTTPVLREGNGAVTGHDLLQMVGQARAFLAKRGLKKGDRCGLLGANSTRWVAVNLAMMSEGLIVVPLYSRQAPAELVAMMKDCSPALICSADTVLRDALVELWHESPPHVLFEDLFAGNVGVGDGSDCGASRNSYPPTSSDDLVTIIYTSGTSGEAKGVMLNAGNVKHMLACTSARLDLLMEKRPGQDRVFHYLPFCFAGSWILLLTCLLRGSELTLNTDLTKIAGEMPRAAPHYFLNVPQLLERMKKAVEEQIAIKGGIVRNLYGRAQAAWKRKNEGHSTFIGWLDLATANATVFPAIRKKMIGPNLQALICGSAPLPVETQLFFEMLGIAVLQVYGLTETTAICTMDIPHHAKAGWVGPAIDGLEMTLGEGDEIRVRGPNIFSGYWNRPQATTDALRDGWFHTGDRGERDSVGNWRVVGRMKNLLILGSGHNVAPEPIEAQVLQALPAAQQAVLLGNGRGYLTAIVTGSVTRGQAQAAFDRVNQALPHYKQVRAFHLLEEPFSIENGLLTANGKLKRDLIATRFKREIEAMYAVKAAS